MSAFKKAEKKKSKLRLGLSGPSGSGKTYSALRLAKGLGGRIAVIDTENGSASLYADQFEFDVLELKPPFLTSKFIDAIQSAEKEKYDVIIVDSISHQWAGEGGLLREKEKLDSNPKSNSFANWAKMTPIHDKFVNAIVQCTSHIIVTMRSKEEYSQQRENDKTKIVRLGLSPVQREGLIYELTTVLDVAMNHECETSKDRTGLFVDKLFKITEETGVAFINWLNSGKEEMEQAEVIKDVTPKPIVAEPIKPLVTEEAKKPIVNHAPKPQEPITYKNFTFKTPPEFQGKRFDQIEFAVLDDYMNGISFKYTNQPIPEKVQWFFDLYSEFINKGNLSK